MSDGVILSARDAARTRRSVEHFENQVLGQQPTDDKRRQFFQQVPFRQFQLLESAAPPESVNSPRSVAAQPFEGIPPELTYENGEPKRETVEHAIPGLWLCDRTLVWCIWAYGAWRILHAEQWPVMVQQIDPTGFPSGSARCTLTIDEQSLEFDLPADASKSQLLELVRTHPAIKSKPQQVQAVGGPLTFCALNLMFGPQFTGRRIEPLAIDNSGMTPGQAGLRLRLLAPLWTEEPAG